MNIFSLVNFLMNFCSLDECLFIRLLNFCSFKIIFKNFIHFFIWWKDVLIWRIHSLLHFVHMINMVWYTCSNIHLMHFLVNMNLARLMNFEHLIHLLFSSFDDSSSSENFEFFLKNFVHLTLMFIFVNLMNFVHLINWFIWWIQFIWRVSFILNVSLIAARIAANLQTFFID